MSHLAGSVVQAPSSPLVIVELPLPPLTPTFQPSPCDSIGAASGSGPDFVRADRAVRLAEGVAADDQRCRLLVVHRHPAERLADVVRRLERIRLAVGPLGVDVDEPHLHGAERTRQLALALVALVAEPRVLRTPEDLLRLPDIRPAEAEPERLEAHRLHGDVAGEDEQVGPRDRLAVLLLDRP